MRPSVVEHGDRGAERHGHDARVALVDEARGQPVFGRVAAGRCGERVMIRARQHGEILARPGPDELQAVPRFGPSTVDVSAAAESRHRCRPAHLTAGGDRVEDRHPALILRRAMSAVPDAAVWAEVAAPGKSALQATFVASSDSRREGSPVVDEEGPACRLRLASSVARRSEPAP